MRLGTRPAPVGQEPVGRLGGPRPEHPTPVPVALGDGAGVPSGGGRPGAAGARVRKMRRSITVPLILALVAVPAAAYLLIRDDADRVSGPGVVGHAPPEVRPEAPVLRGSPAETPTPTPPGTPPPSKNWERTKAPGPLGATI